MSDLTRRDFLKLMASSTAGAVLFDGCAIPEQELVVQSPVKAPEDLVTGLDAWYATVCRECPAGCGIIVRVVEGRAKKIEGNPDYPLNRGKSCARGQAGVQALYHPDRIRGPLRRTGERGSGQFELITWDQALDELVGPLQSLRARGDADTVLMVTEPLRGSMASVVGRFAGAYGGRHLAYEPLERTVLHKALEATFGEDRVPEFDIENTQYLLSFGADFLETWLSPVRYARAYGEFRQGRPGKRGTLVQVDPRFSMTAANADLWIPIRPGTEGVLALSLAYVIVSQGLGDRDAARIMTGGEGVRALEAFAPEKAAQLTGVPVGRIQELAQEFAEQRPSLAIGGGSAAAHTNGFFNLSAIFALNFLVGSVGVPGGILFNPDPVHPDVPRAPQATPFGEWRGVLERMRTRQPRPINLLLVWGANPVHGIPAPLGFREALNQVERIVSFSSFLDDTAAQADLILPVHHSLEDWGDDIPEPGPGHQVWGIQQPIVNPLYDTRSFADVLLGVARRIGGGMERDLPWGSYREVLLQGAQQVFNLGRGSVRAPDVESFWNGLLQRGGWWDVQAKAPQTPPVPPTLPRQPVLPDFAGTEQEYPFHLMVFPSLSLTDGRGAHLPWLQATPDPVTTVTWQTWLEVNPAKAREMGIEEGDIVVVESPQGAVEVSVYVHPAIPPEVVAMPLGQGHTSGRPPEQGVRLLPFLHPRLYPVMPSGTMAMGEAQWQIAPVLGRWAEGRGINPLSLLAPLAEKETGALAWAATRVRITNTGRSVRLPKAEGSVPAIEPEGAELVPVTTS